MIEKYTNDYSAFWEKSQPIFPFIAQKFAPAEKRRRETLLDQYIESVKELRKDKENKKKLTPEEEQTFVAGTQSFLRNGLDFSEQQLQTMFSEEIRNVTQEFVRQAREFDAALSFNDIFQACRNVWIMNGLQIVLGMRVQVTPSIFAYSLLYPYTDNLLDNPSISSFEKIIFSQNFYLRLDGQSIEPNNPTERIIFSLVEMIEAEFPRAAFPEVYQSLLAIHDAQTRSLQLIHSGEALSETETLQIGIAKGGASVLADGYLVAGKLSKNQESFLFGYGAYLQLLDDIQDVEEDRAAGLNTIFSMNDEFLEQKLNKTYWFGEHVMQCLSLFGGLHLEVFGALMRKSIDLFIIEAIAQKPGFYSPDYVAAMEAHSPFGFSYIQKQKEELTPYNGFMLSAFQEIAFNEYLPAKKINGVKNKKVFERQL